MFRQVRALFRGAVHDAAEDFTDRNALLILRQQIRDSAQAIAAARKAVAVAIAQNEQELAQHNALVERITDLETRAVSALEQDKTDLARDAAEAIAHLEAERATSEKAQAFFAKEIGRLKANVREAESRLRDLQRGQRLASATESAQKLRADTPDDAFSGLADAEATLLRLQRRQTEIDLATKAMLELDREDNPARISERLAEAGCGAPLKSSTDEVLQRLAEKVSNKPPGDGGAT